LIIEDASNISVGSDYTTIKSKDKSGRVIYLGDLTSLVGSGSPVSYSKVFSPGMRVGYIVASEKMIEKFIDLKQAIAGTTNSLVQILIAKFIENGMVDEHVKEVLIPTYKYRADAMREALQEAIEEFGLEEVSYDDSTGGLFVWVKLPLPDGITAEDLLKITAGEGNGVVMDGETIYAAFVSGGSFSIEEGSHDTYIRLCFSTSSSEDIRTAIFAIMKAVYEMKLQEDGK